ncbi:MAG: metallophosphoesterase family protein [Christensenellales bacterium]|jgi:putative phosphoesterase
MRIIVVSDSHRRPERIAAALHMAGRTDWLIHLGDGLSDLEAPEVKPLLPSRILTVLGNNDLGLDAPLMRIEFPIPGQKLILAHGHTMGVRHSLIRLQYTAMEENATFALFGHTHYATNEVRGGVRLLNPGSVGELNKPSFAVLELKNGFLIPQIIPLQ